MNPILVIDDDPFFFELIQTTLSDHTLCSALDHAQALDCFEKHRPDLIILDIQMGESDGYTICRTLRTLDSDVPILFVSSQDNLDSRLRAYGEGGNDFIAKPYQKQELTYKAEKLIGRYTQQQRLQNDLDDSASLIHHIQKEAASLQTINRFIQSCMHCKDLETLFAIFFIALRDLNTSGVLMIANEIESAQSSGTDATRLELEILGMSQDLPRIHSFGNDRALFSWGRATLLVRELGSLIDVLAILMDALDVVLCAIETESGLVQKITQLEDANSRSQSQVESLISDMTLTLQDSLITLGLVSDLSSEEEKTIGDIVTDYGNRIRENMAIQYHHSQQIRELVEKLRSPSREIQRLLDHARHSEDSIDSVELF